MIILEYGEVQTDEFCTLNLNAINGHNVNILENIYSCLKVVPLVTHGVKICLEVYRSSQQCLVAEGAILGAVIDIGDDLVDLLAEQLEITLSEKPNVVYDMAKIKSIVERLGAIASLDKEKPFLFTLHKSTPTPIKNIITTIETIGQYVGSDEDLAISSYVVWQEHSFEQQIDDIRQGTVDYILEQKFVPNIQEPAILLAEEFVYTKDETKEVFYLRLKHELKRRFNIDLNLS